MKNQATRITEIKGSLLQPKSTCGTEGIMNHTTFDKRDQIRK